MSRSRIDLPCRQRGIATILALVFVGLAVSVAVFSVVNQLRGAQEQSLALHTQTQAQAKNWAGVEIVAQYFRAKVESNQWQALKDAGSLAVGTAINMGIAGLAAEIVDFQEDVNGSGNDRVTVDISATTDDGTRAEANSWIRAVYQYQPGGGGGNSGSNDPVMTFNHDLRLGGNIEITTEEGYEYEINVRGELDATYGNSIRGVDIINATDSIAIGSGSTFKRLNSNGDIRLTGSVTGDEELNARGNVCLTGGTGVGAVRANGFVYGSGSASFGDVEAIGSSSYQGSHAKCDSYSLNDSHGNLFAVNMAGNNNADSIKAKASVRKVGGSLPNLLAEGDFHIGYGNVSAGSITGAACYNSTNTCPTVPTWKQGDVNISVNQGITVEIQPVPEVEIPTGNFDAYLYRTSANYALYMESGEKRITVRNVSGIPDGDYYLSSNTSASGPKYDRICSTTDCNGTSYPFCKGYSDYNSCFQYNSGTKTWSLNGTSLSPGLVWVEGNLAAGNGTYYNTFISTGNITTSGSHKTVAPNFAGYGGGNYNHAGVNMNFSGICTNATYPHYPTQLCGDNGNYDPDGSGGLTDFAYMAGSLVGDTYQGGDITLGASTVAFGSVLAGDTFNSGGSTTIFGYVSAQGQATTSYHQMGGSTRIIVDVLPPTYVPRGSISLSPGGNGSDPASLSVLWTRYL